jgi:predicted phosphodiesterase
LPVPRAAFVLLSDTHFGASLRDETKIPPFDYWRGVDYWRFGRKLKRYFEAKCTAHDFAVVKTLPSYIRYLFTRLREQGFEGDDFDLYLFIGDHVTWPSASSFRLFKDYVSRGKCSSEDAFSRIECDGLNIKAERILLVPGNHDKLLRDALDDYHLHLSEALGLPSVPETRGVHLTSRRIRDTDYVFIIVDANTYCEEDHRLDREARRHLAAGKISPEQQKAVRRQVEKLKVVGASGHANTSDYSQAVRILLVHYCPDIVRATQGGDISSLLLPHDCPGLMELIRSLSGDIDLVVHGHLHHPASYVSEGIPVISLGSAFQIGAAPQGFYILKCFDRRHFVAEHHVFRNCAFTPDLDRTLDLT